MLLRVCVWLVFGLVAVGVVLWGLTFLWQWLDLGAGITGHGWFAYILGGVLTLGLSMGLMMLSFHSARHGHDEIGPPVPDDRSDI